MISLSWSKIFTKLEKLDKFLFLRGFPLPDLVQGQWKVKNLGDTGFVSITGKMGVAIRPSRNALNPVHP